MIEGYQVINATPADINVLREFSNRKEGFLGVNEDGLYHAHRKGPGRISHGGVFELARACSVSHDFASGKLASDSAAVLADLIIAQYARRSE